jgi:drug/metabolite transporter (DMT)-like permease
MTTAGNAALILAMVPLFVAVLSAARGTDHLRPHTWFGILLAFAGMIILTTSHSALRLSLTTLSGDALILLCAVAWAVHTVFSQQFLLTISSLHWTTLTMAVGVPVLVAAALPELVRLPWAAVTWPTWATLAFSTFLAIGLGYVVWYRSLQTLGGPRTAVYSNLIPVVALAASWPLLNEQLGLRQAVGAVIVLVGVWVART